MTKSKFKDNYPRKSTDVPATQSMLYLVRDELRTELNRLENQMHQMQTQMEDKMQQMQGQMEDKMQQMQSRLENQMEQMQSRIENQMQQMQSFLVKQILQVQSSVTKDVHQMKLLYEEQNARNIFVLDGYASIHDRVEKLEKRKKRDC